MDERLEELCLHRVHAERKPKCACGLGMITARSVAIWNMLIAIHCQPLFIEVRWIPMTPEANAKSCVPFLLARKQLVERAMVVYLAQGRFHLTELGLFSLPMRFAGHRLSVGVFELDEQGGSVDSSYGFCTS